MNKSASTVRKGLAASANHQSNLQLDQVDEVMKRISCAVNDKLSNEIIYYLVCLLSTATQYFSIYRLNVYIFNFQLLFYSLLVMTRRVVSRFIKAREASDPLNLLPSTPVLKVIHRLIVLDIAYLSIRIFQETESYTSLFLLVYYHLVYYKYGSSVTEKEHLFGFNHDLGFYFKVIALKLSEMLYFSYLLPLKFVNSDINYDYAASLSVAVITSINLLLFFTMEIFVNIGMINKIQAKKFGYWKQISTSEAQKQNVFEWKEPYPFKRNAVVNFKSKYYRSMGKSNLAQPGQFKHTIFYVEALNG